MVNSIYYFVHPSSVRSSPYGVWCCQGRWSIWVFEKKDIGRRKRYLMTQNSGKCLYATRNFKFNANTYLSARLFRYGYLRSPECINKNLSWRLYCYQGLVLIAIIVLYSILHFCLNKSRVRKHCPSGTKRSCLDPSDLFTEHERSIRFGP